MASSSAPLSILLAQASSTPTEIFDSLRQSPYAPYLAAALLGIVAYILLKAAAKLIVKFSGFIIAAALGFLAWKWWETEPDRSLNDIKQEWFEVIEHTDFSKESIQGLVAKSTDFLDESLHISQDKGREATRETLTSIRDALDGKIREAAASGQSEARARFQQLREEVRRQIAELKSSEENG